LARLYSGDPIYNTNRFVLQEMGRFPDYERRPILSATVHPDIKRTLVTISERTGMSVSQVTDEVLYTGLIEMQELPEHEE